MAKILVVEDEPDLRDLVVEQLEDEGHQVFEAGNGQQALDGLADIGPDLILSDITMPVMDGYEFFQTLKENHPEHAHTPFIYLTALSDREDELKGLRLGVDAYITKPIDYDLLTARVESILRIYSLQKNLLQDEDPKATTSDSPPPTDDDDAIAPDRSQTMSLEKLRKRVGGKWPVVSKKILRNVEQIIRNHLSSNDIYNITPTEDVTIYFADLPPDQIIPKIKAIHSAIWQHLFGDTEEIPSEAEESSEGDAQLLEQDLKANAAAYRQLEQIFNYEDLHFIKLLSTSGVPSKIVRLSLNKYFSDKIGTIFEKGKLNGEDLIKIQKLNFVKIGEKYKDIQRIAKSALVVSVSFPFISDEKSRKNYALYFKTLEERLSGVLIIEVTDTPENFASHIEELEPLPVGRRVQALELRTPEQIHGLDMKQLHCSIISMKYEDAVQSSHDDKLRGFRQELKRLGTKFYIKDIPEGALTAAQKMRADLYSMQK